MVNKKTVKKAVTKTAKRAKKTAQKTTKTAKKTVKKAVAKGRKVAKQTKEKAEYARESVVHEIHEHPKRSAVIGAGVLGTIIGALVFWKKNKKCCKK